MHLSKLPVIRLFFIIVGMLFIASSCDSPPSGTETDVTSSFEEQFFAYSDSSNSLLTIAVDTLKERNEKNNFIGDFVKERGFPAWDNASAFYQDGLPIMLVPVTRPAQKKVSGIIFLTINDTQPVYRWIPRDSEPEGFKENEFEHLMLIFEHQIFGEVQNPDVSVKSSRTSEPIKERVHKEASGAVLISWVVCGNIDAGADGHWGDTQCTTFSRWVSAIDSGGGSAGFGGSGGEIPGGGGTDGGFAIKIIFDSSFINTKAECAYNKLNQNSTSFRDVINEFAGENTTFDLVFKVEDIPGYPDALGGTTRTPNQNNEFTIIIDKSHLATNASLDVARTLLHEGIHAELRRKIASIGGIGNVDAMNFPGIFDYFDRYGEDWPHNQMAEHYISAIVNGLKEYDNGQHNDQFYKDLAWRGLEETRSWDEDVSPSDSTRIRQAYQNLLNEPGATQCN